VGNVNDHFSTADGLFKIIHAYANHPITLLALFLTASSLMI